MKWYNWPWGSEQSEHIAPAILKYNNCFAVIIPYFIKISYGYFLLFHNEMLIFYTIYTKFTKIVAAGGQTPPAFSPFCHKSRSAARKLTKPPAAAAAAIFRAEPPRKKANFGFASF